MKKKDRRFDEIYDVFALRVIVPSVDDCYKSLGVIHTIWKPKTNRFKDYIAMPKPNGYRSLHTTIFGPEGKNVEFQIRTQEMHDESIYGLSAHWYYKGKGSDKSARQPYWIKEILKIQKNINTKNFIEEIKLDIFRNRIFVYSPKGDIFELPEKATPIDFAYAVHTDIGNKTVRALVNDKISNLEYPLKNGDIVEIITDKNHKYPNKNWMKFVKTKKAKEKIKQYSKKTAFNNIKDLITRNPKENKTNKSVKKGRNKK
jgi:GTP pyrophosphokinase